MSKVTRGVGWRRSQVRVGHSRSRPEPRAPPALAAELRIPRSLSAVQTKPPARADHSPGLRAAHPPPRPRGRRSAGAARPGASPQDSPVKTLLTWSRAAALSDRRAGWPPFARDVSPRAASRAATQADPPPLQRATPPAALARPASAITRFPAPARSHTPPETLIGSLPHPPGVSWLSIGPSRMPVK